ncbi:cysteine and histidine-rich domain-containing protein morgana [Uranotaenia lowii]|uniref:cysteine and histidine-rich domain-containing protein morgana n=1 Tax=Uranotaenia lowii TaxID=190385 RepID=UPI002478F745|nr:cysteine and histidine-rich domain-containing protein morgana [Uranotaenia lowii]XP_055588067.1 cysteine and histidine-rich domain-containing protein morgana [Uranotaenia lowii]
MVKLVTCYNRGCGQKFDPDANCEDSCIHHPGVPFFHDAYKGWTCCNKKSVDFTEFLNIKGCTSGKHSDEKPPEPEKPDKKDNHVEEPVPEKIPEPIRKSTLVRPEFDSPLTELQPTVAPAFKKQMDELPRNVDNAKKVTSSDLSEIQVGTTCKHGGCQYSYEGTYNDDKACVYHPGVPIFHEGMKFWSCCQRKTSDFTAFMNQPGCETGHHKWFGDEDESTKVKCRLDWHQTATQVVVTVYAKMYDYQQSTIQLNPIRCAIRLVFPQQNNAEYNLDMELRGVVDVDKSRAQMFGTKVEITLIKAEPGTWTKLDFPREKNQNAEQIQKQQEEEQKRANQAEDDDSDVDLDDIEPTFKSATLTEIARKEFK